MIYLYLTSGQSLVNDPGMTDAQEVKASIKLMFKNTGGNDCVATRSLQVTKKKAKLEYKALEGTIRAKDENGNVASTSMKCSEMDAIIPHNLGVSPAILENVIFVHQDDSNWPMQEGNILKKKFDDVFESTRYTKALDALSKTRKDIHLKAKDLKAELNELGAHLMHAMQCKRELEAIEKNKESHEESLKNIADQLKENDNQVRNLTVLFVFNRIYFKKYL